MSSAKNRGGRPRTKRSVSVHLVPRRQIDTMRLARALLALARQAEERDLEQSGGDHGDA